MVLSRVIAFDGDDTLWQNETLFSMTQNRFCALLTRHVDLPERLMHARQFDTERRNLAVYGYGIKGFVLSTAETAIEVTDRRIPAEDIQTILPFGRTMIEHPVEVIQGAWEVLETLCARDHALWLISKGDLFGQESKIARSGLAPPFERIEIVSEEDQATYERLLARYGVDLDEFLMVGNSLRSDVLPVIAAGVQAVHVPYQITWEHETVEMEDGPFHWTAPNLRALLDIRSA
ncbi:HAD family hydrolase [Microvirga massiliensis]|uniref:HAD family hydrolase n=1 Tax=Microvirga massiliensis TaxID=1033741 RepID=UPI00062BDBF0|nr:HAD family hydrolase [Microvirga massiliensis]